MDRKARNLIIVGVAAFILIGCTNTVHLRDPKTGQSATCGGEMWKPTSAEQDQHCVDYWRKMGFQATP